MCCMCSSLSSSNAEYLYLSDSFTQNGTDGVKLPVKWQTAVAAVERGSPLFCFFGLLVRSAADTA